MVAPGSGWGRESPLLRPARYAGVGAPLRLGHYELGCWYRRYRGLLPDQARMDAEGAQRAMIGDVEIECVIGDITRQPDCDAVVNAANAELTSGGGVAGAIHRAAGPGLAEECRPLAPIKPGQAVITGGHGLPNRHVIHCLGPVYGVDEPSRQLLADCYRNAVRLAEERGLASIAFPAIAAGIFGYPAGESAEVAASAMAEVAPSLGVVRLVRFVFLDRRMLDIYEQAFARAGGDSARHTRGI
jgi:O-acetyl-ADP-ribose deacetylase (regulator of RNase III)